MNKRVEHELLGKGTIVAIDPHQENVVQVHFDNYQGKAQWMLNETLKPIKE